MSKRVIWIIGVFVILITSVWFLCNNYCAGQEVPDDIEVNIPEDEDTSVEDDGYMLMEDIDEIEITISKSDVELIAKTIYGEARGSSIVEQSAVVWCILNRVDRGYGNGSIEGVITAPYQFTGYKDTHPVKGDFVELAVDILLRWQIEKLCIGDVGRTLPKEYLWFRSEDGRNVFRDKYNGDYHVWDWSCLDPYP